MKTLEAISLSFLVIETRHIGMDLHELQRDLLAGFLDLGDGFGAFHGVSLAPLCAGSTLSPKFFVHLHERLHQAFPIVATRVPAATHTDRSAHGAVIVAHGLEHL